jgi:hypothetical protein
MSFEHIATENPEQPQESKPAEPKKLESVSNAVGFDVPVESIPLPSRGLLYPPDHPLHCAETVDIKCMTAKEEDLLTSRALIKNGTVFSKLIQSCILNKSLNAEDLLTGDRNAILFGIRVTGYGAEYPVRISCPACEEEFEAEFNLGSLEIKHLGAEPIQPGVNAFSFVLPVTKKEVIFKLLTGTDERNMSQEATLTRKKLGSAQQNTVTNRLFYSILQIGEVSDKAKLKYMIQNLPARDSRALRSYMDKIEPDLNMSQQVVCSACGEGSVVDIPLARNFLWPD